MSLSIKERSLIERISKRLTSDDPTTYRSAGRSIAHQIIARRGAVVRALRGSLGELLVLDEHRRGYREALEDVLVAAEAAIEPEEQEARARAELAETPELQELLDHIAEQEVVLPGGAGEFLGKSPATGTRRMELLYSMGLVVGLPSKDERERPYRLTELGARLANASASQAADDQAVEIDDESQAGAETEGAPVGAAHEPAPEQIEGALDPDEFRSLLEAQAHENRKAMKQSYVLGFDFEANRGRSRRWERERYQQLASSFGHSFPAAARITRYALGKFFVFVPTRQRDEAVKLAIKLLEAEDRVELRIRRPDTVSEELKQSGSGARDEPERSAADM